jgi:hypothetical protein
MLVSLSLQTLRYAKLSLSSAARRKRSASIWSEALSVLKAGDVDGYARPVRLRVEESGTEAARQLEAPANSPTATATTRQSPEAAT